MADIPYDAGQGEDLYDGTIEFNAMDNAYDPATASPYLMEARDAAQFRDFAKYISGADVIGNAKKIRGVSIETGASTPANLDVLQYDSGTGTWLSQPIDLGSVEKIALVPQSTPPAHAEGTFYYDDNEHAFVAYNEESDVAQSIGQETFARVYNNTGSGIANGAACYINGATSARPTVALARADQLTTSRFLGMATHSIENGTYGYVTVLGIVHDVNTNSFTVGDMIYLSPTTAGAITNVKPTGEDFVCDIGTVLVKSATVGSIYVNPSVSELTVEMSRHKGFPANATTEATLSFVEGTRTFSITPASDDFHFYQEGIKYLKFAAEDLVIANTTGTHFIYYNLGVLTDAVNPTDEAVYNIVLNYPIVSFIYWNATTSKAVIVAEERHKTQTTDGFTPRDHLYDHIHFGSQYTSGMTPTTVGTGGDGSLAAHAQFGIGAGLFDDEDISISPDAIASTVGLEYIYKSGTGGDWVKESTAGFSFPVGATPLPQYNQFTGSTWQLTQVTSGNFMLIHVFGANSIDDTKNYLAVLGQNQYTSLATAQTAALTDIGNFNRSSLPFVEFTPVATFILECKTSFTNAVNARLVVVASGASYQDFRTSAVATGGGGGSTSPGGVNTAVQYNSGGTFAGSSDFTFNSTAAGFTVTNMTCVGVSVLSNASITGGTIDGPSIGATTEATINHDALQNYDANEHVDHTGVTITAGVGLSGGGTLAANRTIDLNITELSAESSVDRSADYLVMYDTSASAHKKVLISNTQTGFTNPMTTAGDIIIGGGSGAATRLGIGTSGYILTSSGSAPVWSASSIESNPNVLINTNGLSIINQRGATTVAHASYGWDRWKMFHNCTTVTLSQETTGAKITATTKGAGTYVYAEQSVELYNSYASKPMIARVKLKSNKASYITLATNSTSATSATHSGGGAYEIISVAFTPGSSPGSLRINVYLPVTADGNYAEIAWIKLEEGSVATPWVVPDPALNNIQADRYTQSGSVQSVNGTLWVPFRGRMRGAPAVTVSAGSASNITEDGFTLTHNTAAAVTFLADEEI